jgi:hypothetical protein
MSYLRSPDIKFQCLCLLESLHMENMQFDREESSYIIELSVKSINQTPGELAKRGEVMHKVTQVSMKAEINILKD